mmetsp:Transcript_3027/g.2511  ORF Transcript_3027/g.2511 Transcript_3027/m.2511 type:complete len:94 (+) Transcript_3027:515-796(+)
MAYSFFWTAFIYHQLFDSLFGLVLGASFSFLIQCSDGLNYFDFYEPTATYTLRFLFSRLKSSIIELYELYFETEGGFRSSITAPYSGDCLTMK